ncbi:MAG: hypothetical protein HY706_01570 [Candidatus Hydrogenedentes bacterium]|nr:hypothetical protein [Candidatus Hydrogenedentota bacterium]
MGTGLKIGIAIILVVMLLPVLVKVFTGEAMYYIQDGLDLTIVHGDWDDQTLSIEFQYPDQLLAGQGFNLGGNLNVEEDTKMKSGSYFCKVWDQATAGDTWDYRVSMVKDNTYNTQQYEGTVQLEAYHTVGDTRYKILVDWELPNIRKVSISPIDGSSKGGILKRRHFNAFF